MAAGSEVLSAVSNIYTAVHGGVDHVLVLRPHPARRLRLRGGAGESTNKHIRLHTARQTQERTSPAHTAQALFAFSPLLHMALPISVW